MRTLLLLSFLLLGTREARSQSAVFNNFSSTVKGVTIGAIHCYFWVHGASPAPWDSEVACYISGTTSFITVNLPGTQVGTPTSPLSFSKNGALITWTFTPNGSLINYSISGLGPSDSAPLITTGTF